MAAILKNQRRPVADAAPAVEERPFISVIVPVRNEEAFIENTLGQLLRQDYEPFEVLVADGESTDATRDLVRRLELEFPNLRLLSNPCRWSSAGRNAALAEAQGDLILIVDGHCDVGDSEHLRHVAEAFHRSGADCIGRPQPLDVPDATTLQRAIALARASRIGHHPDSSVYSAQEGFVGAESVAVAYRRAVFETVGTFDESFDACEDVEFNHRVEEAGLRCFFTPRVAVRYYPRSSLIGLFRQMARYGRGRVRLLRKHPRTFSLACVLPAIFLLGLLAGLLLASQSAWLACYYVITVGLYALVVMVASVFLSVKARDLRPLPWLPLAFVTIHAGAGAGVWLEWLLGCGASPAKRRKERRVVSPQDETTDP